MQQRTSGRMLHRSLIAVAVAAAFALQVAPSGFGCSVAQAQEAVRPEVGKPLQAARDLYKQGKYKEALAKVREAEAVPNRNAIGKPPDRADAGAAVAGAGGVDTEQAIKASQALIGFRQAVGGRQARHAANLASLYYRNREYANAAKWADQRAQGQSRRRGDAQPA